MDVSKDRPDFSEKRADAADARMAQIADKLEAMKVTLAGLATKGDVAGLLTKDALDNWGLTLLATMIGTGVAATVSLAAVMISVAGQFTSSSANQLAEFQAGITTIQAVVAARDVRPSVPALLGQPEESAGD
jgi:hypothetical protein